MESARWDYACRNGAKYGGEDEGNKQDSDEWGIDDGDEEHKEARRTKQRGIARLFWPSAGSSALWCFLRGQLCFYEYS